MHTVSHTVHIAEKSSAETQEQPVEASGLQDGSNLPTKDVQAT